MDCPLCSTAAADGATECPSCGAIFAKLREREEREKRAVEAALARAGTAAPPLNAWALRAAAAAAVAAWLLGLGLYYRARTGAGPRARRPPVDGAASSVRLRDPATGKLVSVDVHLSPLSARPEPPPAAAEEPAPPTGAPAYDPDFDD